MKRIFESISQMATTNSWHATLFDIAKLHSAILCFTKCNVKWHVRSFNEYDFFAAIMACSYVSGVCQVYFFSVRMEKF
jgi:hypothetical protein